MKMKKALSLIFCVILAISLLAACGGKKGEQIQWSSLELGNLLPEPQTTAGKVGVDLTTGLSVTLSDITKEDYKTYRDACIEKGYTIESEDTGTSYVAFNSEGYELRLVFFNDELSIHLDAPEKMDTIKWPTTGLGAMLPATKSTLGRISWDNSETFIVHIGDTSLDALAEYVTLCENQGFTINHSKSARIYKAENKEGYSLSIMYLGFNNMEISLQAPKGGATSNTTATKPSSDEKIGTEFKAAMDSYEKFMDEYVAIVKKYKANPTDLTILASYTDYMSKYATFVADFVKWENEELNAAELAYYIEVQGRVSKKLLEVAQ